MVPSRCGQSKVIGGGKRARRGLVLGILMLVSSLCRVVEILTKGIGMWSMAGRNPLSREGSREGCNCSHCGGGRVAGGVLGMYVEEIQSPETRGESPRERWFDLENSPNERCSLYHLERELNSSPLFEHGGGQ